MYSNEYLEYWGEVYAVCRLFDYGTVFQEFLEEPWRCLCELGLQSAPVSLALGYQPLLPRQGQVAQGLWKRWEDEDDKESQSRTDVRTPVSGALRSAYENKETPLRQPPGRPVRELVHAALSPAVIPFPRLPRKP